MLLHKMIDIHAYFLPLLVVLIGGTVNARDGLRAGDEAPKVLLERI